MVQPRVTIHGQFTEDGYPAAGMVQFSDLHFSVDTVDNTVHTPVMVEQFLDQNGEFWCELPLNVGGDQVPEPRSYRCVIAVSGHTSTFDFVLTPYSLDIEFSDIIPVSPVPALPPAYVASIGGMTGNIGYDEFLAVFPTLSPAAGKSAYQLWLDAGNTGSFNDFLTFITGPQGAIGPQGVLGLTGATGLTGPRGPVGPRGRPFFVTVTVDAIGNLTEGGTVVYDTNTSLDLPKYSIVAVRGNSSFYMFDGVEWILLGTFKGEKGDNGLTPTKADIGLGNVDNTADVNKPISGPVQTALNTMASTVGQVKSVNSMQGDVVIGRAEVGLANVDNTSDVVKLAPLTTQVNNLSTQLGNKQQALPGSGSAQVFLNGTLNWAAPTPAQVGLGNVQNFPNMGLVPANTDLNTFTTTGTWVQDTATSATTALHYPLGTPGFLQVLAGAGSVVQYYTSFGNATLKPLSYRRAWQSSGWSPWIRMTDDDYGAWTTIALRGGWMAANSGVVPQWRSEPGGVCRLRGALKKIDGSIFNDRDYPITFRDPRNIPQREVNFACATDYMTVSVVRVRIMPDTQNLDMLIANDTAFQGRTLWLDNISYDALG